MITFYFSHCLSIFFAGYDCNHTKHKILYLCSPRLLFKRHWNLQMRSILGKKFLGLKKNVFQPSQHLSAPSVISESSLRGSWNCSALWGPFLPSVDQESEMWGMWMMSWGQSAVMDGASYHSLPTHFLLSSASYPLPLPTHFLLTSYPLPCCPPVQSKYTKLIEQCARWRECWLYFHCWLFVCLWKQRIMDFPILLLGFSRSLKLQWSRGQ